MPPIACALIDRQVTMTDTLDQRMFPALVLRELLEGDCDALVGNPEFSNKFLGLD